MGGVLGNDTDPDTSDMPVVSAVAMGATTDPITGGVGTAVTGAHGNLTLNADGSYDYELTNTAFANALAVGESLTDTFTYEINDQNGGTSQTTLEITINGTNDRVRRVW